MSDTDKARNADENAVDAVFVIGTGSKNDNEELKYALRNLERNCPFVRDVYISGECPSWVDTSVVKHLKWPDRFRHAKDANIIDKLRHACEQPGIAKKILFCSDDQFQTRECTWEDFEPRWLRQYRNTDKWYEDRHRVWHTRLRKTLERDRMRRIGSGLDPDHVYYYQPHIWMPIDRDKFIDYAVWSDYEKRDDTIIASGYFNFVDAGGNPNFDHVFISPGQKWPVSATHIAYTDASFAAAMKYLKKEYPDPSRFEVGAAKPDARPAEPTEPPEPAAAVPPAQESTGVRDDPTIIHDFIEKIEANKVWHGLRPEVAAAERLREAGFQGWKRVWNDIIRRWNATTDKGRLYIPVTARPGDEAVAVLERFGVKQPAPADAGAEPKKPEKPETPETPGAGSAKKCSKCEERRRKAEEARKAAQARQEARLDEMAKEETQEAGARAEVSGQSSSGRAAQAGQWHLARSLPHPPSIAPRPPLPARVEQTAGCVECAIDHLAVAIAYLSSNVSRPDMMESALARGEVQLAAQHLLALGRTEEYNRCAEALDSVYSAAGTFSAATFKNILKRLTDG